MCLCVCITEEQIQKHSILCEEAIRKNQPQKMVDNTASIARYVVAHVVSKSFGLPEYSLEGRVVCDVHLGGNL